MYRKIIYLKKKLFFKDATQKSARVVPWGIAIELEPREPIFEKCPHLREKGGVLTLTTPVGFVLTHTVSRPEFDQDHESGLRSDRGPVVLCDFSKL